MYHHGIQVTISEQHLQNNNPVVAPNVYEMILHDKFVHFVTQLFSDKKEHKLTSFAIDMASSVQM